MMRRIYRDGGVSPLPKEDVEVEGPYHIAALVFEAVRTGKTYCGLSGVGEPYNLRAIRKSD